MVFQRFFDRGLAQASYMIGCQITGDAIVVDPNRDLQQYIDAAAREKLRITHVTETHIHADFVSGSRELAHRTGAQLLLSDEGDADWKYAFEASDGARLLKDGNVVLVGNIRLDVMHTPGHTPEHVSFLVTDTPAASGPWGLLSGDFVFVGDVGRPDLLERAAGQLGTMEASAHTLFRSLERFRALPDHLQVWPGHGAGSACGKALGAVPSTTVGYEKIGNWGVGTTDEAEFVRNVLVGQPEPPPYFAEMKRINKSGPRMLGDMPQPPRVSDAAVAPLLGQGALVVDTRTAAQFARAHIPGTINIPVGSIATWAGWLLPYDRDVYVLVDSECPDCADRVVRQLALIGLDLVSGVAGSSALAAWTTRGDQLETTRGVTTAEAADMLQRGLASVVDVRAANEWESGHIAGAPNMPLGHLTQHIHELPSDKPVILQCQGGTRSVIAASLLQAKGFKNVINLLGGMDGWRSNGQPVERDEATVPVAP
ncbi:MAG: rhodanese-like domain-containing protein [Gemmatimonas sp.]